MSLKTENKALVNNNSKDKVSEELTGLHVKCSETLIFIMESQTLIQKEQEKINKLQLELGEMQKKIEVLKKISK